MIKSERSHLHIYILYHSKLRYNLFIYILFGKQLNNSRKPVFIVVLHWKAMNNPFYINDSFGVTIMFQLLMYSVHTTTYLSIIKHTLGRLHTDGNHLKKKILYLVVKASLRFPASRLRRLAEMLRLSRVDSATSQPALLSSLS